MSGLTGISQRIIEAKPLTTDQLRWFGLIRFRSHQIADMAINRSDFGLLAFTRGGQSESKLIAILMTNQMYG